MLTNLNKNDFIKIYDIMKESFPYDEIRSFEAQEKLLEHKNYKILTLEENNDLLGFLAIWYFADFIFLEHFAISPNHRNKGLGNKILQELQNYSSKKIILEVEHPTTDISIKRIDFYKRCGFNLFDFDYIMPAYSKNHKDVPLMIMSNANLELSHYNDFYKNIVNVVNA